MDQDEHVDEEMLADVLMLMEDEAADGILRACDLFRSSVPDRLDDIDSALTEGRFVDAGRASHSLRGSAGAFGARRLSALGLQLEELCRESDAAGATAVLADMREEFLIFRDILDARLEQFR
jgi:HPt (histidine-containing phosphotransfer) domain-containing protein